MKTGQTPRTRPDRRRERGISHVSITLEAAAVMAWFVVLVLGEVYVGRSVASRRTVERAAAAAADGACGAATAGTADVTVEDEGALEAVAGAIPSILDGTGIASSQVPVYAESLLSSTAEANGGPVGVGAYASGGFYARRSTPCAEKPLAAPGDPTKDLAALRKTIFDTNVLGY